MSTTFSGINRLRAGLHALSEELSDATFAFDQNGDGAELRDGLGWMIDEYIIPRLADLDGPVVAVLIGSTGAGKSTILNSLAGAHISEPGAVRPTTRAPTVWCHPNHAERFGDSFLSGYSTDPEAVRSLNVVSTELHMLENLAVVDAPDFDSVVDVHREIADQLLAVADVCIFVTSAQRYADAVPWEFLEKAKARAVPIRYVVNRLPPPSAGADAAGEIVDDFRARLLAGGLDPDRSSIIRIREQSIDPGIGGLVAEAVEPITAYLRQLSDPTYRHEVIIEAAEGAVAEVVREASKVADLLDDEIDELDRFRRVVDEAYSAQQTILSEALDNGTLIRGEVVKRWQEFVGTGELLKLLTEGASKMKAWSRRVLGGHVQAEAVVGNEARSELATTVVRRADLAARAVAMAWETSASGRMLLDAEMWGHGPELDDIADDAVQAWMSGLTDLVREQGEGKQRVAKAASLGVNAVAVTLLVTVFVHTGGLTGAEVGVAAGAAAAQQGLLEHLFGSAAASSLAQRAREQLDSALDGVLAADAQRFYRRIDEVDIADPATIRRLAAQLQLAAKAWHDG